MVGRSPRPFWRKGEGPTYAPAWSTNRRNVTHEVAQGAAETSRDAGLRLYAALQQLSAGDHLIIRAGTYNVDRWLRIRARGTEHKPIFIRGAPGETVIITRPDAEKNVIDIDESQYLVLESLQIRGGSNGIKFYSAEHVMLSGLNVTDTDGAAITANAENTSYLTIVDCDISRTGGHGEAIYLGSHDGSKITHHTAIVGNSIHDLVGDHVTQGDGIEIKQGSYSVWIKYNVIRNTNYPGIVVYGTGRASSERNVIEANVIIDSHDYALQASADVVIRNNLVVNTLGKGRAFLSKPEEAATPARLLVVNNTFLAKGRAVTCRGWDRAPAEGIVFANNAVYSASGSFVSGSLGKATTAGNINLDDLSNFADVDFGRRRFLAVPKTSSQLHGVANIPFAPRGDLNGSPRRKEQPDVGALLAAP